MEEILKTLVEIPSITGNYKTNNEAIEYIDRYLSEYGLHVKRFEFNGVESLVATTRKTKKPRLLLTAHVDVVPAPKSQFMLREEDGRYYGRGVFDMKFAIAAYLKLIDELNGSLNDYDLGLMITSDEEIGGFNGVEALIKEGYSADIVVLPDAGDTPDGWKLERSAKGKLSLEVSTTGKSAHGSRPWLGENAIDKLTTLLGEIRQMFNGQNAKTKTLSIGVIKGGEMHNLVPAAAMAELDVRTLTDVESDKVIQQIGKLCEKHGAELKVAVYGNACGTDVKNPLVAEFIACVKAITGKPPTPMDSTGGSDARFFAKAGVPCIVANPQGDGYHMAHEWVSKEGLDDLVKVLHLYARKIAKTPATQTVDAEALTV